VATTTDPMPSWIQDKGWLQMHDGLFEIQLTHVRMESIDGQEPMIIQLRWFRAADGETGEIGYDDLAKYLARGGNAFFKHYGSRIPVVVERRNRGGPVVRVGVGHRRDHKLENLPDF
jgi:hypothetical protein